MCKHRQMMIVGLICLPYIVSILKMQFLCTFKQKISMSLLCLAKNAFVSNCLMKENSFSYKRKKPFFFILGRNYVTIKKERKHSSFQFRQKLLCKKANKEASLLYFLF